MKPDGLIRKYLAERKMMQLATVDGKQPWVCTVHYVEDDLKLYWLSLPARRHSQELAKNQNAAIAVAVKLEHPVVGVQAEGTAEIINDKETIKSVMKKYVEKFGIGGEFYNNFIAGKNKHLLYCFTPKQFVLFDEVNFPDNGRREWKPV